MRTVTRKFNVYRFSEANIELRDKIREGFANDPFHAESMLQERIETLKKFAEFINGKLYYSISCVPDRGEFISITDFDQTLFLKSFKLKNCALTGVCYDDDLIDSLNKFGELKIALNEYLNLIHEEYEFMLTDEYLCEFCEANDYEFEENGNLH